MTNKEYYGDGSRAKAEYDKLGCVSFTDWLNQPCKEALKSRLPRWAVPGAKFVTGDGGIHTITAVNRSGVATSDDDWFGSLFFNDHNAVKPVSSPILPDWVKPGAVYRHHHSKYNKFKVREINWDVELVVCEVLGQTYRLSTSFKDLSDPKITQHEPEFQIPDWIKPGVWLNYYHGTDRCWRKVLKIDPPFASRLEDGDTIRYTSGGFSTAEEACRVGLLRATVTPWTTEQWLKEMRKGTKIIYGGTERLIVRVNECREIHQTALVRLSEEADNLDANSLARDGETKDHNPCGTIKLAD